MGKLRVAAYCRVSTETEMQTNSYESQKQYFEKYIRDNAGYELYKIYADYGISGTDTKKRSEFNNMIADAKQGKLDLILTKEVSRFARNIVDTLEYTRLLKEYDVGVFFMNDNINTLDKDGELRLAIMSSIAQDESRKISERVKWGMRRGMERGVVYTSPVLGYDLKNGTLTVNTEEAALVKEIFFMYAYRQMGASAIARYLTDKGVKPPKRIRTWSGTTITRILKNEKYAGDLIQGKTTVKNFLNHKSVSVKNTDEMITIPDHHEAIIDRTTWLAVKSRFENAASAQALIKKASNSYWCSGKIKCGHCGKYYTAHSKKLKNGSKYVAWRCVRSVKNGSLKTNRLGEAIGCSNKQINHTALEECVKYAFLSVMHSEEKIKNDLTKKIYGIGKESDAYSDTEKQFNKRHNENTYKQDKLFDLYYSEIINKQEFIKRKEILDREKEEIESAFAKFTNNTESKQTGLKNVQKAVERLVEIIDKNEYNSYVYSDLVKEIIVIGKKLIIYFKHIDIPIAVRYQTAGKGKSYEVKCTLEAEVL